MEISPNSLTLWIKAVKTIIGGYPQHPLTVRIDLTDDGIAELIRIGGIRFEEVKGVVGRIHFADPHIANAKPEIPVAFDYGEHLVITEVIRMSAGWAETLEVTAALLHQV